MPFPWIALAISAAFTFLGQLLTPKRKNKDAGLEGFQVPTATEDRPKPMWVGTVRHKSPNCIWYGDYSAIPIKNKVSAIGAIASFGAALLTKQIIGYKYNVGAQLDLGWGTLDEITRITLDDKEAWTGSIQSGTITIDKPTLFGSTDEANGNGGFQAQVVIYPGDGTQDADPYVVAKSGATPAYSKDALMVFKGLLSGGAYVGNSPNFPEISVDARRCPNTLGVTGGKHVIDSADANPVCALYEFMTRAHNEFGGGFSPIQFDTTSWITAANTVYTEGLGISRMFDSVSDVDTVIGEYLDLIDAVININMTTGKFELVLARADYDPDDVIELTDDDIIEITSYKRGSWIETFNEARMSYIDRTQNFESIPIAAQDGANSSGQAEVRFQTIQIQGVSNPTTANKVIWRELRVMSTPLATIGLKINRKGFGLYGGAVFKYAGTQIPEVVGMIFRCTEIDSGALTGNAIDLKGVQDVFALGSTAYLPPAVSTWEAPVTTGVNIVTERLVEQPYFFHETDGTRVFTVAKPENGAQIGYNLYTHEGTDAYAERQSVVPFTPTGTLDIAYTSSAYDVSGGLIVTPDWGMDDLPDLVLPSEITAGSKGILVIDDEILAYESYTIDGFGDYVFEGVWGGLLDTILAPHSIGARVWFISEAIALDPTDYTALATVKAKLQSLGATGSVALASCTEITI